MADLTEELIAKLIAAARQASHHAYAPYSHFAVGAAVLTASGKIFSGCNVENASYGLACCAERNAIFQMVAGAEKQIACVVVFTATNKPTAPCGACRQVINEFSSNATIVCACDGQDRLIATIDQLLPDAFGPHNLT